MERVRQRLGWGGGKYVHKRVGSHSVGKQKFLMLKGASSRNTARGGGGGGETKKTQNHQFSISRLDSHWCQ